VLFRYNADFSFSKSRFSERKQRNELADGCGEWVNGAFIDLGGGVQRDLFMLISYILTCDKNMDSEAMEQHLFLSKLVGCNCLFVVKRRTESND
jgi:hypothetical protein